ncbi:MAG: endonuclease III [Candidatus Krumholzibacteria bacterium]|nr:endonuclease III [Candidatus Krumholzibacteria bacterium]
MLSLRTRRQRARKIVAKLREVFPDSGCSLTHQDPWQLLVATILSAQCTDARVNQVTPGLFAALPSVRDFAAAPLDALEDAVRPTGFFRNKARSLQGAAQAIVERHGGKVPSTLAELVRLPGVGRKTANVVLGEIWDRPDGVVVDTHVSRIAQKLGLTDTGEPAAAERQLNEVVPREHWRLFTHLIIDHGRRTCRARRPLCDTCPIYQWCEVRA